MCFPNKKCSSAFDLPCVKKKKKKRKKRDCTGFSLEESSLWKICYRKKKGIAWLLKESRSCPPDLMFILLMLSLVFF